MGRAALAILVLCAALGGCAAARDGAPEAAAAGGPVRCEAPRPQVCTMIYAPVCATLADGGREDYASPCNACADAAVISYSDGPCDEGRGESP